MNTEIKRKNKWYNKNLTPCKGTIKISTSGKFPIIKSKEFENLNNEIILNDLNKAAIESNFLDKDDKIISFNLLEETNDIIFVSLNNFAGISYSYSYPSASDIEKSRMKSWSKFWVELTKLGYKID